MRVVLATIALNEAEFIGRQLEQHRNWPGLVGWVWVEGAAEHYGRQHPKAVTDDGRSVDATSRLLAEAAQRDPCIRYVAHGWARGNERGMGGQKIQLRNAYCKVADELDADVLIVIDADEFYSKDDQERILDIMATRGTDYDAFLFRQRHLWRPPSMLGADSTLEVTGGYWAVPHVRVWWYERGARYQNHNHLALPGQCYNPKRLYRPQPGDPECLHLGFARDPRHRLRTNAYYVARGEGRERGFNRQHYVDCRDAWATWLPDTQLPNGAKVAAFEAALPEVLR